MGRKGKEMSPDLKKVTVDLFKNGENMSDIARLLQQPRSTISEDLEKGGQLSTNGVKLFSVTSHKFVLGRTSVYMYGRNVVETEHCEGENGPQIQCQGVGMHLLQLCRNTYQGGRECKF
jgi:hypothetical protein